MCSARPAAFAAKRERSQAQRIRSPARSLVRSFRLCVRCRANSLVRSFAQKQRLTRFRFASQNFHSIGAELYIFVTHTHSHTIIILSENQSNLNASNLPVYQLINLICKPFDQSVRAKSGRINLHANLSLVLGPNSSHYISQSKRSNPNLFCSNAFAPIKSPKLSNSIK